MIFENRLVLEQRIQTISKKERVSRFKIFKDTSEFMDINTGDVLRLGGNDYLVTGTAKEGRFGIDDQPKFWVRIARDLTTGKKKIIKLVFHETFKGCIGSDDYTCFRSPEKEAAVMEKMSGHPNFMQGRAIADSAGNIVRIIDFISGPSLYQYLRHLSLFHQAYFFGLFPEVMRAFLKSLEAIVELHGIGGHHGDIRADHIIVKAPLTFMWIDFDYDMGNQLPDVYCLGNVLQQVVGKGRHSIEDIRDRPENYPMVTKPLSYQDMSLMFRHRVINLRKLFPYIHRPLNDILMRFSTDTGNPYSDAAGLLSDLRILFPRNS